MHFTTVFTQDVFQVAIGSPVGDLKVRSTVDAPSAPDCEQSAGLVFDLNALSKDGVPVEACLGFARRYDEHNEEQRPYARPHCCSTLAARGGHANLAALGKLHSRCSAADF